MQLNIDNTVVGEPVLPADCSLRVAQEHGIHASFPEWVYSVELGELVLKMERKIASRADAERADYLLKKQSDTDRPVVTDRLLNKALQYLRGLESGAIDRNVRSGTGEPAVADKFAPKVVDARTLHWDTKAGQTLDALVQKLPAEIKRFYVFGSGALLLALGEYRISEDLDVFASVNTEELKIAAQDAHGPLRIDISPAFNTSAPNDWRDRAMVVKYKELEITVPHYLDILLSKIPRVADKDIQDFNNVIRLTGHPTEAEFKRELQKNFRMLQYSDFDGNGHDPIYNVRLLWERVFHRKIDPRAEIISPEANPYRREFLDSIADPPRRNEAQPLIDQFLGK